MKLELVSLLSLFLGASGIASAGALFTPTGGNGPFYNGLFGGPGFSISAPIKVDRLGAYTFGATHWNDSIVYLEEIGTNTIIAMGTVVDGTPKEADNFAYVAITPVTIGPGNYIVIGESYGIHSSGEGRLEVQTSAANGALNPGPGITFIGSWFWYNPGDLSNISKIVPSTPTYATDYIGVGGLDFVSGGSSAPEPGTWAMVAGAAAAILAIRRRKSA